MGRPRGYLGEAMRIASYNVENMFERPKVFARDKNWTEEAVRTSTRLDGSDRFNDVIGLHAELNQLFSKDGYSSGEKDRMAEIIGALGLRSSDNVSLVTLRVRATRHLRNRSHAGVEDRLHPPVAGAVRAGCGRRHHPIRDVARPPRQETVENV